MIRISNRTSAHCCVTATELLWHISSERKHLYACPGVSVTRGMMELTSSSESASECHQVSSWKAPNSSILSLRVPARLQILQDQSNPQQTWSNMIKLYQMQDPAKIPEACCKARSSKKQYSLAVASISNIQNQIFSKRAKSAYLPSGIYSRKIYSCLSWTSCPK